MSGFDEVPPDMQEEVEATIRKALDLRLDGDVARRFAEGATSEGRQEALRELERIEEKVSELTDRHEDPAGLVDVDALSEDLLAWARRSGGT